MGYLTESIDLTTRKIVRDIVKIIRNEEEGSWMLPFDLTGDEFYDKDVTVYFDWNTNWKEGNQRYFLDGDYDDEDDSIKVTLFINKEYYPELLYDLIADLNDVIAHEYEHVYQFLNLRPNYDVPPLSKQPKNYKYYLQPHEVPAVLRGLRRVMKLRKINFEDALTGWYNRSFSGKEMKTKDFEKLKSQLKLEYEKMYGTK